MDKIIESLVSAGPLMAVVIAIVILAGALWTLAGVIKKGFEVLMAIHNQSTRQLRLTRKAILKASAVSTDGLQKVSAAAENTASLVSRIEASNKLDHEVMFSRIQGAETSITQLEASTQHALVPLIKKVDDLFDLVNKLKLHSDSSLTIDQVTNAMRASLTSLEINMVQKFTDLASTIGTGPVPSINVEVSSHDTE